MQKNNTIYLNDIIDACNKILSHTDGVSFEYFCEDELLTEFVIRMIEVIGEACNSMDEDFVKAHPEIPVRDATNMRNKLIHEYRSIDHKTVWATVQNDIKPLLAVVEKAKSGLA